MSNRYIVKVHGFRNGKPETLRLTFANERMARTFYRRSGGLDRNVTVDRPQPEGIKVMGNASMADNEVRAFFED